jgi:prolyl-tRNA synthetase
MRQSQLFTKTKKLAPKDEVSKNAQLLIRAGYIHKEMAGVYSLLPLGLRVINKIEDIIREEMNMIGGQEVELSTLQNKRLWQETGRWDSDKVDNWFKTKLSNDTEVGLAFTHEEPLTKLLINHFDSHKDLPLYIYQFQTKFRNEKRAKSGIMRGREFLMKDLYSFHKDEADFKVFYEKCAAAYLSIFRKVGIGELTYRTKAAGGSFTESFTDEFQTISDAGEDTIFIDETTANAYNSEIASYSNFDIELSKLKKATTIEVGNIFPLGTKFSESLGLDFKNESGKSMPVIMGSYGIGLGRLMGTVVEVLSDESGIIWPESISPFQVHLLILGTDDNVIDQAEKIYSDLSRAGVEVLFDDRDQSPGIKLSDADLIGIPHRLVVSSRSLDQGGIEYKRRDSNEVNYHTLEQVQVMFN